MALVQMDSSIYQGHPLFQKPALAERSASRKRWRWVHHHEAHALFGFLSSPFSKALAAWRGVRPSSPSSFRRRDTLCQLGSREEFGGFSGGVFVSFYFLTIVVDNRIQHSILNRPGGSARNAPKTEIAAVLGTSKMTQVWTVGGKFRIDRIQPFLDVFVSQNEPPSTPKSISFGGISSLGTWFHVDLQGSIFWF